MHLQEFRRRIAELADEFEPTEQTIPNWSRKVDPDEGKRVGKSFSEEKENSTALREAASAEAGGRHAGRWMSFKATWFAKETGDVPPESSSAYDDVTSLPAHQTNSYASRNGCHAWWNCPATQRDPEDAVLTEEIGGMNDCQKELCDASSGPR